MSTDMFSWQHENIIEPPLTRNITCEEIDHLIQKKEKKNSPNLPCHTQEVERCVKLVTEASAFVLPPKIERCINTLTNGFTSEKLFQN